MHFTKQIQEKQLSCQSQDYLHLRDLCLFIRQSLPCFLMFVSMVTTPFPALSSEPWSFSTHNLHCSQDWQHNLGAISLVLVLALSPGLHHSSTDDLCAPLNILVMIYRKEFKPRKTHIQSFKGNSKERKCYILFQIFTLRQYRIEQ